MDIDKLFREHNSDLVRYLRTQFRDDADDIAQQTWMKIMASDAFDPAKEFRPWLLTVAYRTGLDYQRRKRNQEKGWVAEELSTTEECGTHVRRVSDVVADQEEAAIALTHCSREAREIIELVALDYTQREAAERLKLPLTTLRSRLYGGSLRRHIEK